MGNSTPGCRTPGSFFKMADDEKVPVPSEEKKSWLPNPREGEHVFGVAHIFASFNDTFVVRLASARLIAIISLSLANPTYLPPRKLN